MNKCYNILLQWQTHMLSIAKILHYEVRIYRAQIIPVSQKLRLQISVKDQSLTFCFHSSTSLTLIGRYFLRRSERELCSKHHLPQKAASSALLSALQVWRLIKRNWEGKLHWSVFLTEGNSGFVLCTDNSHQAACLFTDDPIKRARVKLNLQANAVKWSITKGQWYSGGT